MVRKVEKVVCPAVTITMVQQVCAGTRDAKLGVCTQPGQHVWVGGGQNERGFGDSARKEGMEGKEKGGAGLLF